MQSHKIGDRLIFEHGDRSCYSMRITRIKNDEMTVMGIWGTEYKLKFVDNQWKYVFSTWYEYLWSRPTIKVYSAFKPFSVYLPDLIREKIFLYLTDRELGAYRSVFEEPLYDDDGFWKRRMESRYGRWIFREKSVKLTYRQFYISTQLTLISQDYDGLYKPPTSECNSCFKRTPINPKQSLANHAAENGYLIVLKWLLKQPKQYIPDGDTLNQIYVIEQYPDVYRLLLNQSNTMYCSQNMLTRFALTDGLDILEQFAQHLPHRVSEHATEILDCAVAGGQLHVVQWAHTRFDSTPTRNVIFLAETWGYTQTVKWIRQKFTFSPYNQETEILNLLRSRESVPSSEKDRHPKFSRLFRIHDLACRYYRKYPGR